MRRFLLPIVLFSACAHPKPAPPPPDLHSARLAAAAAQVKAGCLDCLLNAFREYDALRAIPAAAADATAGSGHDDPLSTQVAEPRRRPL